MRNLKWPHGPETLVEHLERFSTYLYRKRDPEIANMSAMTYALYLHYKTDTGFQSDIYEDLARPLKNKVHLMGLGDLMQSGKYLIERIQNELDVIVEK
jgi:hypothetical protein